MQRLWNYVIGTWPVPAAAAPVASIISIILRLYLVGAIGYLAGLFKMTDTPVLGVIGFIPYGFDKVFGGNVNYAMGPDFFQGIGMPFPEITALLIGLLELFGGIAVLFGLLTRPLSLALGFSMVVALITVNNYPEELPLMIASFILTLIGGGMWSIDNLLARRTRYQTSKASAHALS